MVHRFLRRICTLVVAALMAATVTSAQSGTGWAYDRSTKTLTLSGDEVDWSGCYDYFRAGYESYQIYAYDVEKVVFAEDFSVETTPSGAFYGFSNLTRIEIPDCVKSIGDGAFYECEMLTTVTLPATLNRIGNYAFYGCTSLETVIMHSNGTAEDKHCILLATQI